MAALWVVFCISVVSGNVSPQYLPLSFTQAVSATSPFFTALFAFLVTAKREARTTYATLIPVIISMVMASGGEPSLHLLGFIFCVVATAARAFKSVLQGTLLSSEGETMNSMNLLFYLAPISPVTISCNSLVGEKCGGRPLGSCKRRYQNHLVLVNATGVLAAVLTICIFKNQTTVKGFLGDVLTVIGAVLP